MNTNIDAFSKQSLDKTADDICELMDNIGFTSEYPIDANDLRAMIVDVLRKNLDKTPVLVTGVIPEPVEIIPTVSDDPDGGCHCGCGHQRQPGE